MTTQPWGADRPLDETRVRALLTDSYPDLPVRDVRFLAEGWDSQAYEIDGTWIFRFPKRADIQKDLEVEASLLPHLAAHLARVGIRHRLNLGVRHRAPRPLEERSVQCLLRAARFGDGCQLLPQVVKAQVIVGDDESPVRPALEQVEAAVGPEVSHQNR
jgi:hypothetical protein